VISGSLRFSKPNPRIFQYLLSRYSLSACDTLFVDDVLKNVEAAKSLKIQGVLFNNEKECEQELLSFLHR
jgi:HAD superfamily hydrolase (TIGR01509 family)